MHPLLISFLDHTNWIFLATGSYRSRVGLGGTSANGVSQTREEKSCHFAAFPGWSRAIFPGLSSIWHAAPGFTVIWSYTFSLSSDQCLTSTQVFHSTHNFITPNKMALQDCQPHASSFKHHFKAGDHWKLILAKEGWILKVDWKKKTIKKKY